MLFPSPILSNRIVGQDVEINEDQVSHLVPAPDGELHLRTWKTQGKVHDRTSIIEMLRRLDRDESMEFARIVMISLPARSIADMRKRGLVCLWPTQLPLF